MSSRPSGPSSRPVMMHDACSFHNLLGGNGHRGGAAYAPVHSNIVYSSIPVGDPPRLRERGALSRITCCAFVLSVLCGGAFVVVTHVLPASASSPSPPPPSSFPSDQLAKAFFQSRQRLRRKSLLQKLSLLRRQKNGNGLDLKWTAQLFPHWFEGVEADAKLKTQTVVEELALATSLLLQSELEDSPQEPALLPRL